MRLLRAGIRALRGLPFGKTVRLAPLVFACAGMLMVFYYVMGP